MVGVRELTARDFEQIHERLLAQGNLPRRIAAWRLLLDPDRSPYVCRGQVLVDGGRIVGVLGTLFSERIIGERSERFCNLHTWIVEAEYRGASLLLMRPVLRLQDCTLTDFTPSRPVVRISKRLGFRPLDSTLTLMWPCRRERSHPPLEFVEEPSRGAALLSERDRRAFADHQATGCGQAVLWSGDETCYVVYSRLRRFGLPYCHLHHVGNAELFARFSRSARAELLARTAARFATIERRLLGGRRLPHSLSLPMQVPQLYRSDRVSAEQIDTLYSENVVHGRAPFPGLRDGLRRLLEGSGLVREGESVRRLLLGGFLQRGASQ